MSKIVKVVCIVFVLVVSIFTGYHFGFKRNDVVIPATILSSTIVFQGSTGGCGNILVYKTNSDDTAGVSVSANEKQLNLSSDEKVFEIGKTEGLTIELSEGKNIKQLYCNDVPYIGQQKPKKLIAKSGQAIISISKTDKSNTSGSKTYTTAVILKNVRFVGEDNTIQTESIGELIFKDVLVGWLAG